MVAVEGAPDPTKGEGPRVSIIPSLAEEEGKAPRDAKTGTKLRPICIDEDMKKQATSAEELKNQCFSETFSLIEAQLEVAPGVTIASLSSTSISTISKHNNHNNSMYSSAHNAEGDADVILSTLMEKSEAINSTVANRTISRHGRSTQRWAVDAKSKTRLVTGCVPILKGGKIMLVSASKKNEWILPKGGWEMDEEMEESAIRETFEEAGVIGTLGPKLSEVIYETRKSKKRREDKLKSEGESQFSSGWSDVSQLTEDDHIVVEKSAPDSTLPSQTSRGKPPKSQDTAMHTTSGSDPEPTQAVATAKPDSQDNGQAAAETSTVYSHVCVSLFPLYVKDVMSSWPESGRIRKAVDIDEAIESLAGRPEMQSMLLEVKAKGLHRVEAG